MNEIKAEKVPGLYEFPVECLKKNCETAEWMFWCGSNTYWLAWYVFNAPVQMEEWQAWM